MNNTTDKYENGHLFETFIGTTALFGVISNGSALVVLYLAGKLTSSFQQLCFSSCLANLINELLFLLFCFPMAALDLHEFTQNSYIGRILAGLMIFFWNASLYSHLIASVNRYLVITQTTHELSQKLGKGMVVTVWIYSVIHFIPYTIGGSCYAYFDPILSIFQFPVGCGSVLEDILFYSTISAMCAMTIINFLTGCSAIRKKLWCGTAVEQQDMKHFLQSLLQNLLFLIAFLNFYIFTTMIIRDGNPNMTVIFLLNTWCWQMTHGLDGVIVIPFHLKVLLKSRREHAILSPEDGGTQRTNLNLLASATASVLRFSIGGIGGRLASTEYDENTKKTLPPIRGTRLEIAPGVPRTPLPWGSTYATGGLCAPTPRPNMVYP